MSGKQSLTITITITKSSKSVKLYYTTATSRLVTIYTYPINMLLEILSRCPLYLSHGPAALYNTNTF